MRWPRERVLAFLEGNTRAAARIFGEKKRPDLSDLIRMHRERGGVWDHLLAAWLAVLTFGLSAWLWNRRWGSCCFAGYLDESTGRVGCLIHPLRVGKPDLRRHAFPLVPTLGCDRDLRCPMLDDETAELEWGNMEASSAGYASLRGKRNRTEE